MKALLLTSFLFISITAPVKAAVMWNKEGKPYIEVTCRSGTEVRIGFDIPRVRTVDDRTLNDTIRFNVAYINTEKNGNKIQAVTSKIKGKIQYSYNIDDPGINHNYKNRRKKKIKETKMMRRGKVKYPMIKKVIKKNLEANKKIICREWAKIKEVEMTTYKPNNTANTKIYNQMVAIAENIQDNLNSSNPSDSKIVAITPKSTDPVGSGGEEPVGGSDGSDNQPTSEEIATTAKKIEKFKPYSVDVDEDAEKNSLGKSSFIKSCESLANLNWKQVKEKDFQNDTRVELWDEKTFLTKSNWEKLKSKPALKQKKRILKKSYEKLLACNALISMTGYTNFDDDSDKTEKASFDGKILCHGYKNETQDLPGCLSFITLYESLAIAETTTQAIERTQFQSKTLERQTAFKALGVFNSPTQALELQKSTTKDLKKIADQRAAFKTGKHTSYFAKLGSIPTKEKLIETCKQNISENENNNYNNIHELYQKAKEDLLCGRCGSSRNQ